MEKKCAHCGAKLPETGSFCAVCGAPCNAVPVRKEKKVKWWMIVAPLAALLLIAAVVVGLLWNSIYLRLNPIGALSKAFANTAEDLAAREDGTLKQALGQLVDEDGRYTSDVAVELGYGSYFSTSFSVVGANDLQNKQTCLTLEGTLNLMDYYAYDLDMAMYLDSDSMAFNWEQATGTDFYGINFDSFEEDIQASETLKDSMDDNTRASIAEYLDALSDLMDNYTYGEDLQFSTEYFQILFDFLKDHRGTVDSRNLTLSSGRQKCDTVTFTITCEDLYNLISDLLEAMEADDAVRELLNLGWIDGAEMDDAWDTLFEKSYDALEDLEDAQGSITMTFCLYKDRIVYSEYSLETDNGEILFSLMLDENAGEDDIIFQLDADTDGVTCSLEVTLSSEVEEDFVSEAFCMTFSSEESTLECSACYEWDKDSGDLTFSFDGDMDGDSANLSLSMELYEENDGLVLKLPELVSLLGKLSPYLAEELEGVTCNLTVALYPGAGISEPDFINIRDMTEEDLRDMEDNLENNYQLASALFGA